MNKKVLDIAHRGAALSLFAVTCGLAYFSTYESFQLVKRRSAQRAEAPKIPGDSPAVVVPKK